MTDREKALSYLAEGYALLRTHGLYGASDDAHAFAIDRALLGFSERGGFHGAAEASAALQALYEARRLVNARSSIEGRRIIIGDWFMSLAVGLALPLRSPALTRLVSQELCNIGADLERPSPRASKRAFAATIDSFVTALCDDDHLVGEFRGEPHQYRERRAAGDEIGGRRRGSDTAASPQNNALLHAAGDLLHADNKLLTVLERGYFTTAAAETRAALAQMESSFATMYSPAAPSEMDGWIYGALMSGGKRLRPILVRLCAGLGAETAKRDLNMDVIINIMSTIELIHSASLVHDDIVDRSPLRRSRATINAEKGDGYAAMCGFRMIADALELCTDDIPHKATETIAAIPKKMCGGELHQFDIENKPELQSETEYYTRIECKTATLIEGSCVCGAIAGDASEEAIKTLAGYGRALGMLFQLRDDLLDYGSGGSSDGKPVSQDMERGLYSLPLLYARKTLADENPAEAAKLDATLRKDIKSRSDLHCLNDIAESSGGISYTREKIAEYAEAALSALDLLPQNAYTEALALLVTALTGPAAAHQGQNAAESPKIVRLAT
ncbi:MAG: polyprenyl synthetase family protein [Clostridiales bacterium]|nr:polyprenyl synthetase family protein [Clostridiales bacterium]